MNIVIDRDKTRLRVCDIVHCGDIGRIFYLPDIDKYLLVVKNYNDGKAELVCFTDGEVYLPIMAASFLEQTAVEILNSTLTLKV